MSDLSEPMMRHGVDSERYYVTAAGLRSHTIRIHVVRLTVHLYGHRHVTPGRHRLFGHAPAGFIVTLLRDGRRVATTTAGHRNRYHFRRHFTGTHHYRIRVDHVRSHRLRVHVEQATSRP